MDDSMRDHKREMLLLTLYGKVMFTIEPLVEAVHIGWGFDAVGPDQVNDVTGHSAHEFDDGGTHKPFPSA